VTAPTNHRLGPYYLDTYGMHNLRAPRPRFDRPDPDAFVPLECRFAGSIRSIDPHRRAEPGVAGSPRDPVERAGG
jgi:hypothetical protein